MKEQIIMNIFIPFIGFMRNNNNNNNVELDDHYKAKKFFECVIKSLLHVYLCEEGDFDKIVIAEFAQDNITPVGIALRKQYPSIANLCMEYINLNWDIEKFRKKVAEAVNEIIK